MVCNIDGHSCYNICMAKDTSNYTHFRITKDSLQKLRKLSEFEGRYMTKILDLMIEERMEKLGIQ